MAVGQTRAAGHTVSTPHKATNTAYHLDLLQHTMTRKSQISLEISPFGSGLPSLRQSSALSFSGMRVAIDSISTTSRGSFGCDAAMHHK
eukprot:scaffold211365_cov21-Prasinocladus_malaysianus.AAC.1